MTKQEQIKQEEDNQRKIVRKYFAMALCQGRKSKERYKRKPAILTDLKHVSKSGMSRTITTHIVIDNELLRLDYQIKILTGSRFDKNNGGIKIGGCGMDMGFALINHLMHSIGVKNWQSKFRQEWI